MTARFSTSAIPPIGAAIWKNRIKKKYLMDFFKFFYGFLKERKKFWLLPINVMLLIFSVLLIMASSTAIAPFIYILF